MNLYGLKVLGRHAKPAERRQFLDQLDKLCRSSGSQANHNSRRQGRVSFDGPDRGKRTMGCTVDPAQQDQLRRERGRRKAQRRMDRKAGIRT